MNEIRGERTSILVDFALVHLGAAVKAAQGARTAPSRVRSARDWRRAAEQLRKAQAGLAKAELHALAQARAAEQAGGA